MIEIKIMDVHAAPTLELESVLEMLKHIIKSRQVLFNEPTPPVLPAGTIEAELIVEEAIPALPAAPPPPVSTIPVDSTGEAWNPDIHSRTKRKNKDGVWLKLRAPDKPVSTPRAIAPAPIPPAELPPAEKFRILLEFVAENLQNEKLSPERMLHVVNTRGFSSLAEVNSQPEKLDDVFMALRQVVDHG